ncbi:MAG: MBOAT family O-acyltransferase [Pseudomonadota bacterium]
MYFNTLTYFGFFAAVFCGYVFLINRKNAFTAYWLLAASVVFYVVAGWLDTALIACLIAYNWLILAAVKHDKARVILAVLGNIGVLAAIKYRAYFSGDGIGDGTSYIDTVLPLGISFYTFQLVAFHVDAARDQTLKHQRQLSFPLFVIFFPQLIAGPIVRAQQLLPQVINLFRGRPRQLRLYSFGLGLCLLGLTKKIIFADSLAPIVDDIFFLQNPTTYDAWLGAWLFTFQIYFDFSGYSDIALGCAYLLGIRLPWNFLTPYMSHSPREFWQRWHITLSTWIRDYLYIPLGGNRGGRGRQTGILLLVMGLAGLWHGADHTFVLWGIGWGLYIGFHRLFTVGDHFTSSILKLILWLPHFFIVILLWVLFRAPSLEKSIDYYNAMFSLPREPAPEMWPWILVGCFALLLLHYFEAKYLQSRHALKTCRHLNRPFFWGLMAGLCLWLVMLPSYNTNPFIYFRF